LHFFDWFKRWRSFTPAGLAVVFLAIGSGLILNKIHRGYRIIPIDNEPSWRIAQNLDVKAQNKQLEVRAMLPEMISVRQEISSLQFIDQGFARSTDGPYAVWSSPDFSGERRLVIKYRAKTSSRDFPLPGYIEWDDLEAMGMEEYLLPGSRIQSDHADIRAHAESIRAGSDDVMGFVRDLFDYIYRDVVYFKTGGPTDSLTAFRLGEASCNGKNRLMIALARSQGIPARPAKGLILEQGASKSVTHMWTELLLDGQWVPFCPTSGYFARIPEHYLEYPKVDASMFRYTKNVDFSYTFAITRGVQSIEEAFKADLDHPNHLLAAWGSLNKAEFSLDLLLVLLTLPLGVTLVSLMRNVVGLTPIGTFLPALIAVSFRETGLGWGLLLFTGILVIGVLINEGLRALHILHFPRLAVVMITVVASMIGFALLAMQSGNARAASVGMFPVAIMTLTIERFCIIRDRFDFRDAAGRLLVSLAMATACYFLQLNFAVRSAMLVFPEILLLLVAVNLSVGMYTGLRWSEWVRFRSLAKTESEPC